jgi:hypothetical protein
MGNFTFFITCGVTKISYFIRFILYWSSGCLTGILSLQTLFVEEKKLSKYV